MACSCCERTSASIATLEQQCDDSWDKAKHYCEQLTTLVVLHRLGECLSRITDIQMALCGATAAAEAMRALRAAIGEEAPDGQ